MTREPQTKPAVLRGSAPLPVDGRPGSTLVFLPECAQLKLHRMHLERRGYGLTSALSPECGVLVFCADHLSRHESGAAGIDAPKLVVGADPPAGWRRAERLDQPLLPLDLERRILGLLPKPAAHEFRLLLVEDDATIRAAVERTFEQAGFDVRSVGGFAAVPEEMKRRPDIVLLDLNLPGLSGESLGEILRRQGVPICIFSSESAERLEAARARIGALAAFPKGMALSEIAARIREHLEGRKD